MSIRAKFTLFAVLVAVVASSLLVGLWLRYEFIQAREDIGDQLRPSADSFARAITDQMNLMTADAETLLVVPSLEEFADGNVAARSVVEESLFTLIRARPHYAQARLIGRADGWRELIRVNRVGDDIEIVDRDDLQQKQNEPYLAPLVDGFAEPRPYFAQISPNREHGLVEGPPMLRIVRPVHDSAGEIFGAIVFNAEAETLFAHAVQDSAITMPVTLVTDGLDYLQIDPGGPEGSIVMSGSADWRRPVPDDWQLSKEPHEPVLEGRSARYDVKLAFNGVEEELVFWVFDEVDVLEFWPSMRARFAGVLALAAFMILAVTYLSYRFGHRAMRPLRELSDRIATHRVGEPLDYLPSDRTDEASLLAKALVDLNAAATSEANRSRAILNSVDDVIVSITMDGVIEAINPAVAQMFGYLPTELIGQPLTKLMPPEAARAHQKYVTESTLGPGTRRMSGEKDVFGQRRDGSLIPLDISISRANFGGSPHLVGVVRDVSARKEAEEKTARLVRALETSNEDLDRFAYVASHDLRAPLRVIDNASKWLEEDLEPFLNDDTRESLAMLRGRVRRMDRLLDDLLQHSRIGRGDAAMEHVPGDELVADVIALLSIPEGFSVEVSDAFAEINLPRMPMQLILLNLASNALKHHDRKTGVVRLDVDQRPDWLVISVSDDGPGVPADYHRRVFEMFQTLRPRDEVDGSGMGLAIVQRHVEVAGGWVELESDGVRGSTFRVHWPAKNTNKGGQDTERRAA
ncbi:sensor histidine kinase [Pelagovum pacificum]|uniref:histidine kinase n=1 Tax=Pelagovum pacificum TaxID=2588711 RepID=A0A5C5G972_9RHOB|nr:PAS domain S-box protein [Pelagovum pacificum]QQA42182.1 PAS domain S-box protein [Pelagovum pacificum]TNY31268.1 PAS domain S-box protein [Pelagovum pacificum]